jgi:glycosyltransferase involved in cell wall biosynthesis
MTNGKLPRISVCVGVYNGEKHLPATIDCLLNLDYPDYEIIISDNKSTDGTAAVIKRYAEQTGRVKYVQQPVHLTCEAHLNKCLEMGDGELVAVYHGDDLYYRDILKRSAEVLAADPSLGAVVTLGHRVDGNGGKIGDGSFFYTNSTDNFDLQAGLSDALRIGCSPFICSSAMYRRSVMNAHNLRWSNDKYRSSADLGLFFDILKVSRIKLIKEYLMGYRITQVQGSNAFIRNRRNRGDYFRVLRRYRPEIARNSYRDSYYFAIAKDLMVRALNCAYTGDLPGSRRRLRAFFRVFSGKFGFIKGFLKSYAMLLLGLALLAADSLPFDGLRKRLVLQAFRFGRPD